MMAVVRNKEWINVWMRGVERPLHLMNDICEYEGKKVFFDCIHDAIDGLWALLDEGIAPSNCDFECAFTTNNEPRLEKYMGNDYT